MPSRILVPLDGSPLAEAVLSQVIELATLRKDMRQTLGPAPRASLVVVAGSPCQRRALALRTLGGWTVLSDHGILRRRRGRSQATTQREAHHADPVHRIDGR